MHEFTIELAGVPILIRCRHAENRDFFRDYLTARTPVLTIEPTAADLARMQADFDRADAAEGLPLRRRPDHFLENNALHGLLAEALADRGVLLMHGSALCMDGQGIIFTAKSGTGKSTHARLWREVFGDRVWMVNDDKPMILVDEMRVCGTPWDGKHHLSRNASAPLKAIVKLKRAEVNRIAPMRRADALPLLVKQAYRSRNPDTMARILALEARLLDAVDFYELGCNMSPEAAMVAREGIHDL